MADRTYYDALHLTPDAPPELIRAAYRALSQVYHPDKRPGDPGAGATMAAINAAYAVLGSTGKRRSYDAWLRAHGGAEGPEPGSDTSGRNRGAASATEGPSTRAWKAHRDAVRWGRFVALLAAVIGTMWLLTKPSSTLIVKDRPGTAEAAPNGRPWPSEAGYLSGFTVMERGGSSKITIDNTASDGPVYAKLMSFDPPGLRSLRHFYVPAGERFVLKSVSPGNYEVRYMDLDSGTRARTDAFVIRDTSLSGLPTPNAVTVTLVEAEGLPRLEASPLALDEF